MKNLPVNFFVAFLFWGSFTVAQEKIPVYISKPNRDFIVDDSSKVLTKFQFGLSPTFFQFRNIFFEDNFQNYYSLNTFFCFNLEKLSFNTQLSYQFNRKVYDKDKGYQHFKNDIYNYELEADYLLFAKENRQKKLYFLTATSDSILVIENKFLIKPTKVFNHFYASLGINYLNYFLPTQISSDFTTSEKVYFYQSKQLYGRIGLKYRHFVNSFLSSKNAKSYKQKYWLFAFDLLLLVKENPYLLHRPSSGQSEYFEVDRQTKTSRLGSKISINFQQQFKNSRIGINVGLNCYIMPYKTCTSYSYFYDSNGGDPVSFDQPRQIKRTLRFWNITVGLTINQKKWKN